MFKNSPSETQTFMNLQILFVQFREFEKLIFLQNANDNNT